MPIVHPASSFSISAVQSTSGIRVSGPRSEELHDAKKELKIVLLGEPGVGKTSMIERFVYGHFFHSRPQASTEADFMQKQVIVEDAQVAVHIWDTAGQERFASLIPSYLRDADGAIVVYDVTDAESFAAVGKWAEMLEEAGGVGTPLPAILAGNKVDLVETVDGFALRQVTPTEASAFVLEHSAFVGGRLELTRLNRMISSGDGVDVAFSQLLERLPRPSSPSPQGLQIGRSRSGSMVGGGGCSWCDI